MRLFLIAIVLQQIVSSRLNQKRVRIPAKGYKNLRDTLHNNHNPTWTEYEGNESPFSDVLHHSRFNLEELMYGELIVEVLDRIRLEQAEHGENHDELTSSILRRARARAVPYSTAPEQESLIREALKRFSIYDE